MGRERGYPLGARGLPCDAAYEDGSVPLQLPLSCADHLHRSAKRRLSPPGDRRVSSNEGTPVRELLDFQKRHHRIICSHQPMASPCLRCREVEQAADQGELGLAVHVGEKASGGGSREAIRQDMQQETADELAGGQGDDLGPLRVPVVAAAFSTPGPTALWSPGARLPPMMPAWPTRQWDAPRR